MKIRRVAIAATLFAGSMLTTAFAQSTEGYRHTTDESLRDGDIVFVNVPGLFPREDEGFQVCKPRGSFPGRPVLVYHEKISLTFVGPVDVDGDSVATAEDKIRNAYRLRGYPLPAAPPLITGVRYNKIILLAQ